MKSVRAFTHSHSALGQAGEAVCVAELSNDVCAYHHPQP